MARCYQLTETQSRDWQEGSWPSIALEDEVFEWAVRFAPHENVVVVTSDHQIAFFLTAEGWRG
jgi:hypothetical protein